MKKVAQFLKDKGKGYIIAGGLFSGTIGYTFHEGPKIESELVRLGLAGTSAILVVEVLMHAVDTVNMRSKVVSIRKEKPSPQMLLKGITAVCNGYLLSGFLYFTTYGWLKREFNEIIDNIKQEQ
jgi:hypothetical protein